MNLGKKYKVLQDYPYVWNSIAFSPFPLSARCPAAILADISISETESPIMPQIHFSSRACLQVTSMQIFPPEARV